MADSAPLLANQAVPAAKNWRPSTESNHRLSTESNHRLELGRQTSDPPFRHRAQSGDVVPFGLLKSPKSMPVTPTHGHGKDLFLPPAQADALAEAFPSPPEEENGAAQADMGFWRKLVAFTGPGWLMSIAYVDPGNLEADLQCGAQFGYKLLWALLGATAAGLGIQMIAAMLGCTTRKHLAEHCREHYAPRTRVVLWFLTELAIIGSDIQEVIGCSIGLELLFGLRLSTGVLITAAAAFGFLFMERLGTRPLELFFGGLILVLAMSMGGLFAVISPDTEAVVSGLLIPRMPPSAVQQVVGMVGCVIMPHNLYLHSALVQSRFIEPGQQREAVFFFTIESTAAIIMSLLINTSVVAVFAKGFFGTADAGSIGLRNAGGYLGQAYGQPMKIIWALGLVAAGQSSTMTGAYSGQWVMQGFLQLKVEPWKRALITRSLALVPCLLVAIYFGDATAGLDQLNQYLNVLQSLVLPFAAVPVITFAAARNLMGDMVLSSFSTRACWAALCLIMIANIYLFIVFANGDQPLRNTSASGLLGLGLGIAAYISGVIYIAMAPRQSIKDFEPIDQ